MSETPPHDNAIDQPVAAAGPADYLSPPPLSARPSLPGWLAKLTVGLAAVAVPSWLLGMAISLNQLVNANGRSPLKPMNGIVLALVALGLIGAGSRATLLARRGHPLTRAARVLITLMWLIAPIWPLVLLAAAANRLL